MKQKKNINLYPGMAHMNSTRTKSSDESFHWERSREALKFVLELNSKEYRNTPRKERHKIWAGILTNYNVVLTDKPENWNEDIPARYYIVSIMPREDNPGGHPEDYTKWVETFALQCNVGHPELVQSYRRK